MKRMNAVSGGSGTPIAEKSCNQNDTADMEKHCEIKDKLASETTKSTKYEKALDSLIRGPEQFLKDIGSLWNEKSSDIKNETCGGENRSDDDTDSVEDSKMQPMKSFIENRSDGANWSKSQRSLPQSSGRNKSTSHDIEKKSEIGYTSETNTSIVPELFAFVKSIYSLFTPSNKPSSSAIPDIHVLIQQAHEILNQSSSSSTPASMSSQSLFEQILYFKKNAQKFQEALLESSSFLNKYATITASSSSSSNTASIPLAQLFQTFPPLVALFYYLEVQESIKTPSWKRRLHRFHRSVSMEKVVELNEALMLSELSYVDTVEEVRDGLDRLWIRGRKENHEYGEQSCDGSNVAEVVKRKAINEIEKNEKPHWELLFCDLESHPNEPSHFLAIQKNASQYDDTLHVLLVVRGTKNMSDLITDAMMESMEYEYLSGEKESNTENVVKGYAHSGMVKSGKYLVQRHQNLLTTLLQLSQKRKLEINLIGHSLGAGAATIAAMEWNKRQFYRNGNTLDSDNDSMKDIQVSTNVVGFGCPALLSYPLSLMTREFVTTVVADADVIPRMSGATLVNLFLDLWKFDYREMAKRDIEQTLREVQTWFNTLSLPIKETNKTFPLIVGENDVKKVMDYVHQGLDKVMMATDETTGEIVNSNKLEPVLYPPGTCIHFYRDGSGICATYSPCTIFNQIDVTRTMLDDHLISSGYRRIFLGMMRDFHKDDHFSFESPRN